jgi:hypothetical protein
MALKLPPSLHFDYHTCFSGDPAFAGLLPDPAIAPEGSKEREELIEERRRKLEIARDTGDWSSITKTDEQPTLFRLRSIHGELAWIESERQRRNMSHGEWCELGLRYALVKIENIGIPFEVKTEKDSNGRRIVTLATIDKLRAIGIDSGDPMLGHSIVSEIGEVALSRAIEGIRPLR